ncbi:L,D-transpeptidase family protein [Cytobacillus massiliigabonensis]|uniref:L,D-transpeptidase family protein n=1 Tax=Cytobacillus massiliigabonensis TaxID=1871011 RepID=UPI000C82EA65|nr:L,D-transpeptidase family protein [Cytobacillus massiliigabonensis]
MSNTKDVQEKMLSRSKHYKNRRRKKRNFLFTFIMLFFLISLFVAVPIIYSSSNQLFQSEEEIKPSKKNENQEQVLASAEKQELKTEIKVDAIQTKAEKKCTCQNVEKKKEDIRVIEHEVKKKETLFSITMLYFSSSQYQNKIASFNGITNPAKEIRVGTKLNIPDPEFMFYHTVSKGETFASISRKYYGNASYRVSLANFNGINNPDQLKYGETLQIPGPYVLQKMSENKDNNKSTAGYSLVISKKTNQLLVYQDKKVIKTFSVGTGKNSSFTPEGTYKIINKIEKPWYSTKGIPGGDPKNPLGSHWLGLDVPGTKGTKYGIHGTNDPSSIGGNVSLGCIRMLNTDVEWLYKNLPLQTEVTIN